MTRFDTPPLTGQNKMQTQPTAWVKTRLEGADKYSLTIMEKARLPTQATQDSAGCAFAKLSLMESGAVMASFPVMGMVSGTIRSLLGAAWFELSSPLKLPAFVFGYDIEIPAGRHPIVFVLENWVVLFRPQHAHRL
ncbi:MAG: hypothetical protein H7246_01575 [Phycisphaerae bacterium]|nr:hypothetical protein [Saprospiraceae bacterium]